MAATTLVLFVLSQNAEEKVLVMIYKILINNIDLI